MFFATRSEPSLRLKKPQGLGVQLEQRAFGQFVRNLLASCKQASDIELEPLDRHSH
jgi:hypothetical protein